MWQGTKHTTSTGKSFPQARIGIYKRDRTTDLGGVKPCKKETSQ